MAQYVQKPVVVEAQVWNGHGSHPAVDTYFQGSSGSAIKSAHLCGLCTISLYDHGFHPGKDIHDVGTVVCPGDWIVTGPAGRITVVKPDVFDDLYASVEKELIK